jgi:hypothetical protein
LEQIGVLRSEGSVIKRIKFNDRDLPEKDEKRLFEASELLMQIAEAELNLKSGDARRARMGLVAGNQQ